MSEEPQVAGHDGMVKYPVTITMTAAQHKAIKAVAGHHGPAIEKLVNQCFNEGLKRMKPVKVVTAKFE
jgi:hypothetical protein